MSRNWGVLQICYQFSGRSKRYRAVREVVDQACLVHKGKLHQCYQDRLTATGKPAVFFRVRSLQAWTVPSEATAWARALWDDLKRILPYQERLVEWSDGDRAVISYDNEDILKASGAFCEVYEELHRSRRRAGRAAGKGDPGGGGGA